MDKFSLYPFASLALLPWLAFNVLLNTTLKVKCLKDVGHLTKSVGHTQSTLVGHPKSVLLKDLNMYDGLREFLLEQF